MVVLRRAAFCLSIFLLSFDHVITTNTTKLNRVAIDEQWSHWKRVHNKQYTNNEEHNRRRDLWIRNLITVMQHNVNHNLGLVTYSMSLNAFSDFSWDEFRDQYANGHHSDLLSSGGKPDGLAIPFNMTEMSYVPSSLDWRQKGLVREVKNQGHCGSCWAFSTTGALEGQYSKKRGKPLEFSEQQLVDCGGSYGNHGCHGGSVERAFRYLEKYGCERGASYPYYARDGRCHFDQRLAAVWVKSYSTVHSGNEKKLKIMVASRGPVSVAVDADRGFQHYRSGIYQSHGCSSRHLNHAVLVVGYGLERGSAYWIIKNSWGLRWGEQGYIRLARDRGNMCGVASLASVPEIR
ncbi:Secreted cathepsin L 2 [Fasciola hepatica]|uniref:Secreted cathepsin L 2 n=1 Tax=Fasciola hepatica TaxID=6192 RepID=A0A4E0QT59_FASHE|nr:Secreted cathepsin L 2 [Fasciola hepatica]